MGRSQSEERRDPAGPPDDRWRRLEAVLRRMDDARDRDALLALILDELPTLLGVDRLALYEYDEGALLLVTATPGAAAPPRLELGDDDGDAGPAAAPPAIAPLLVPALAQGQLVGVLALERGPAGPPRSEDLDFFQAVAAHVGSALQMRERAQALEAALRDLREVQAELMRAERIAVVGKLAFDVSHDLKNRLTSMTFGVQNVRDAAARSGPLPPAVEDSLDALAADIRRMRDRVEGFSALARDREERLELCRVDVIVGRVLERFRHDPRRVALVGDTAPAQARVDEEQLFSAVANLIINAFEALEQTAAPAVTVSVRAEDQRVRIIVEDNGPGVPPEIRGKVFDAFFGTKSRGAGLGLSQVFVFAEHSGGRVYLADSPVGACFVLELPEATS